MATMVVVSVVARRIVGAIAAAVVVIGVVARRIVGAIAAAPPSRRSSETSDEPPWATGRLDRVRPKSVRL
jgi:hypothetical protein